MEPVVPSVAVIIVNWNCWEDTARAAQSVLSYSPHEATVVVVDNASSDDSARRLSDLPITVLPQSSNLGFAAACNVGARYAFDQGAGYVYFLNPDALVTENTLPALISSAKSPQAPVALGSLIRYADDQRFQFIGSRSDPQTGRPKWIDTVSETHVTIEPEIPTDYIMGAALFVTRHAYETVGGLPEDYFLYFEETAWCYEAKRRGVECKMVSASVVTHKGSATVGAPTGPLQSYFCTRNELLFLSRFASSRQTYLRVAFYAWWIAKLLVTGLLRGRLSPRARAIILGLRDYLLHRLGDCPQVIRDYAFQDKLEKGVQS